MHAPRALLLIVSLSIAATAIDCSAALGDRHTEHARAMVVPQNTADYTVQSTTLENATINEYMDAQGTVFAVTWRGLKEPSMETLLGTYFPEYRNQSASQMRILGQRNARRTETAKIVVRHSGHMRDLHGIAYIKDGLPSGVKPDDLP